MPQNPAHWTVTPLVTPLTEGEALDRESFERLLGQQAAAQVSAVFVLGSAGEGPMLPETVRRDVVATATEKLAGRVPVWAGVSDNSVERVIENLRAAADCGADAGVATLPYYGWPGKQEDEAPFFRAIADASPIPLVVYNLPKVAGVSLSPGSVEALIGHENIMALKDTRADFAGMREIAAMPGRMPGLPHLIGNSALAGRLMAAGANGVVSTLANFAPAFIVRSVEMFSRGEAGEGEAYQAAIEDLSRVLDVSTAAASAKAALEHLGLIASRRTLRPWPIVDEARMAEIGAIIEGAFEGVEELMTGAER
jgi:4-hydroxy-tetrahydrodipicolinate synthase